MSGLHNFTRLKSRPFLSLALVVVSIFIVGTANVHNVSAAGPYETATTQQVNRFLLGRAFWGCLAFSQPTTLTQAQVTTGQWTFGDKEITTTVGPYRANNDVQYCDNYNDSGNATALVSPSLETLGINGDANKIAFACSLNSSNGTQPSRAGGGGCTSGSGGFNMPGGTSFSSFVSATTKNSDEAAADIPLNNLSSSQRYTLSMMALTKSCGATRAPSLTGNFASGDHVINVQEIEYVGGSAVIKSTPYQLPSNIDRNTQVNLFMTTNGNPYKLRCGDLDNKSGHEYSTGANSAAYTNALNNYNTANGYVPEDGAVFGETVNPSTKDAETCTIDGIGWIVCPVMTFMADIVDATYGWVASLLNVAPLETTTGSGTSSIYSAWSMMRNFANVAFVIAFLIIIYSQITSIGLGNYGVKKMLPRLIVAAILVNVSFWLCAIAVDLSNILGTSLKQLFDSLGGSLKGPQFESQSTGSGLWGGLTVAVLGGAGLLFVGLSVLLPALIAAALAIVTVFLVLTLRQALIILLIVISPLAFVAYLLPNTESWFTKWRQLFQTLLLMYPIIAVIFGASAFASQIVMNGATEPDGDGKFAVQVMGALITILPLAITPVVMKTAGGVLNRFGGFINNPNKGPFDRMKKGAEGVRNRQNDRRAVRSMNGGRVFGRGRFQRQAKREAVDANLKRERQSLSSQYVAEEAILRDGNGNPITDANGIAQASRYGKQLAGAGPLGMGADATAVQSALANAQFTIDEATAKEIKAESVMVRNMDASALTSILKDSGSSEARQAAAMQRLIKVGDPGDYEGQVNSAINGKSDTLRRATAEALGSDGPGWLKASDIDSMASGRMKAENERAAALGKEQTSLSTIARDNTAAGVISAEKIVGENNASIKYAFDAADDEGKQRLINASVEAQNNDQLKGKIKHNIAAIGALTDPTKHATRSTPITRTVPDPSGGPGAVKTKTNTYTLGI